jgi:hypothetical protein
VRERLCRRQRGDDRQAVSAEEQAQRLDDITLVVGDENAELRGGEKCRGRTRGVWTIENCVKRRHEPLLSLSAR